MKAASKNVVKASTISVGFYRSSPLVIVQGKRELFLRRFNKGPKVFCSVFPYIMLRFSHKRFTGNCSIKFIFFRMFLSGTIVTVWCAINLVSSPSDDVKIKLEKRLLFHFNQWVYRYRISMPLNRDLKVTQNCNVMSS